jgi:hypothetical protein
MRFDESSHKLVICHHSSSFLVMRGPPRSSFLIIRLARRARSGTTPMTADAISRCVPEAGGDERIGEMRDLAKRRIDAAQHIQDRRQPAASS